VQWPLGARKPGIISAMVRRQPLVLVVDDDAQIRDVVTFALRKEGFDTAAVADGAEALSAFERVRPDAVILDILMPEMDGTEVCRALRRHSRVPVVFLSSKDDEVDRILGLELGGDDYVTKPFSPRELVARVKAVLRRSTTPAEGPGTLAGAERPRRVRHGRLQLDLDGCVALWDGHEVVLTATEFGLLRALLAHPGKVYSRDELMAGYTEGAFVAERTVDSHIRRLRKKFAVAGAGPIETVHGLGYKIGDCR
jgi:two-component system OmpR family response regulator